MPRKKGKGKKSTAEEEEKPGKNATKTVPNDVTASSGAASGGDTISSDIEAKLSGLSKKERRKMKQQLELEMQLEQQLSVNEGDSGSEDGESGENDVKSYTKDGSDSDGPKSKAASNKEKGKGKSKRRHSEHSDDEVEDTNDSELRRDPPEKDVKGITGSEVSSAAASGSTAGAAFGTGDVTLAAAKEERELQKALAKREDGKKLSNREKKIVAKHDEDQNAAKALASQRAAADKFGLEHFSVSQAGKGPDSQDAAEQNAKDVIVNNFTITAYKKELFVNAKLHVVHGRRYGLVGPNGQGKSTLLKAIGARQLSIPDNIDVLYVEQEVVGDDTPAVQSVLSADERRTELLKEEAEIDKKLDESTEDDSLPEAEVDKLQARLNEIYEEMAQRNVENAEPKARKILAGLGFTQEMQGRPTKHFSGGWRMRISLARALFLEPTLLLLDEPTNHLDLNAVIWLDDYLRRWKNTLLVVSHDQDFLSSVVTDIIHLENKQLNYYRGDYESFKAQHKLDLEKRQKEYEKQHKQLKSLKQKGYSKKDAEEKVKKAVVESGGKKKNQEITASADDAGNRELLSKVREYTVRFDFDEVPELSPPVIEVRDASFRYGEKYPWLFDSISFGIDQSSRISIVGPNGVGKSTLIRLLIGDLEPTDGEIIRNRFLRVGVYSQHFVDILPMDTTPVEFLQSKYGDLKYQSARNLLGRFGLEGHAHTIPIADLSGGQKSRVVFANLNLLQPHVLFLDEPTNHLDIESIDALADALSRYNGGVVLVSHDARLIQSADCRLWVCDQQKVTEWDGDFDDYRNSLMKELFEEERRLESEAERMAKERMDRARQRHAKIQEVRKKSGKTPLSELKLPSGSIEKSEKRYTEKSEKAESAPSETGSTEKDTTKKKEVLQSFFKAPKGKKKDKKSKKESKEASA